MTQSNCPVQICVSGGSAEISEQKSRFISSVHPVRTEEEAQEFIMEIRRKYRDANHNCYAYITGKDGSMKKSSDDGEPSRTAGKPILDILERQSIRNICVVVTRYFGGILLGTGGLVRAYGKAASEGIHASVTAERKKGFFVTWEQDYPFYGILLHLAETEGIRPEECTFGEKVKCSLLIPEDREEDFLKKISEMTGGKADPVGNRKIEYCMTEGKRVYFSFVEF